MEVRDRDRENKREKTERQEKKARERELFDIPTTPHTQSSPDTILTANPIRY